MKNLAVTRIKPTLHSVKFSSTAPSTPAEYRAEQLSIDMSYIATSLPMLIDRGDPTDILEVATTRHEQTAAVLTRAAAHCQPVHGVGRGPYPRVDGYVRYPDAEAPSIYQRETLYRTVQEYLNRKCYVVASPGHGLERLVEDAGKHFPDKVVVPFICNGEKSIIIVRNISEVKWEDCYIPFICNGYVNDDGEITYSRGEIIGWTQDELLRADADIVEALSYTYIANARPDDELIAKLRHLQRQLDLEQQRKELRERLARNRRVDD